MTDPIEAMAVALCVTALGSKQCPCKESGKFNCRDEHPGRCATAALAALSETHVVAPKDGLVPVAWLYEPPKLFPFASVDQNPLSGLEPTPLYTPEGIKL